MALKDTWTDLEDAVDGVPDSGSDITVEPINKIAHACIALEKVVEALQDAGVDVDLSDYYDKSTTDKLLKKKEDVSNKITDDERNKTTDLDSLYTDDRYLSARAAWGIHTDMENKILNDAELSERKILGSTDITKDAPYYSAQATREFVTGQIDEKLGDIESLLGGI